MHHVNCENCGKSLIRENRDYNRNKKKQFFCNKACKAKVEWLTRPKLGEENWQYTTVTEKCYHCNQPVIRQKRTVDYYRKKGDIYRAFCNQKCRSAYEFNKSHILFSCTECKKETLAYKSQLKKSRTGNNFCSRSCKAKYVNRTRITPVRSKLERWIEQKLLVLYPKLHFMFNDRTILNGLEMDIFIPELKLAIELNGLSHYQPIYGQENLDKMLINSEIKRERCKQLDIRLIEIDISKQRYVTDRTSQPYLVQIQNFISEVLSDQER